MYGATKSGRIYIGKVVVYVNPFIWKGSRLTRCGRNFAFGYFFENVKSGQGFLATLFHEIRYVLIFD
jgi:hypothetical protein